MTGVVTAGLNGVCTANESNSLLGDFTEHGHVASPSVWPPVYLPAAGKIATGNGIIRNLRVRAETAPGAGETYTITIWINNSASTVTCQLSEASSPASASDLTNSEVVQAGQRIDIVAVSSSGCICGDINVSYEIG
jgi:hypothetical protein